jgi:hypothetical protein
MVPILRLVPLSPEESSRPSAGYLVGIADFLDSLGLGKPLICQLFEEF